jgi:hypothetical protein
MAADMIRQFVVVGKREDRCRNHRYAWRDPFGVHAIERTTLVSDYTEIDLIEDNVLAAWGRCRFCSGRKCETCDYTGVEVETFDLTFLLHNFAVAGALRAAEVRGYLDGVKAGIALCESEVPS